MFFNALLAYFGSELGVRFDCSRRVSQLVFQFELGSLSLLKLQAEYPLEQAGTTRAAPHTSSRRQPWTRPEGHVACPRGQQAAAFILFDGDSEEDEDRGLTARRMMPRGSLIAQKRRQMGLTSY
jgi:hypothetical protein